MLCYMIVNLLYTVYMCCMQYAECRDILLRKIFIGFFNRDLELRTPLEKVPRENTPRIYVTGEIRLKPPPPDFEI